jgi:hypothetical protein
MKDHPERISIDDCRHGWLYRVYSRNLNLGVYREEERGFVGIRHKMGRWYLFTEFHWDIGPPYGTANPLEAICECPVKRLDEYFRHDSDPGIEPNAELFDWIEKQGRRLGITPDSC